MIAKVQCDHLLSDLVFLTCIKHLNLPCSQCWYCQILNSSDILVKELILVLVLIIVFCLTYDMVINRQRSLVWLQCIDCYNAIQQDSGISSQVQSLVQQKSVILDEVCNIRQSQYIHFHPYCASQGTFQYDSSCHLSGSLMHRIFSPHMPVSVTQWLPTNPEQQLKACRRRPASSTRSRMARHWRSLIRHGVHKSTGSVIMMALIKAKW